MFGDLIFYISLLFELVLEESVFFVEVLGLGVHDLFFLDGVYHILVFGGLDFFYLYFVFGEFLFQLTEVVLFLLELLEGSDGG
jgi:hypothetical protein